MQSECSESIFVEIDLSSEPVPDATTLLKFRRFLETPQLAEMIFEQIEQHLEEARLLLREGTIVDATIISAATSTKNQDRRLDWHIAQKRRQLLERPESWERSIFLEWERRKSQVRARVEHPFRIIKKIFKYTKVRYRGLPNNLAQLYRLFAFANLFIARRKLLAV